MRVLDDAPAVTRGSMVHGARGDDIEVEIIAGPQPGNNPVVGVWDTWICMLLMPLACVQRQHA